VSTSARQAATPAARLDRLPPTRYFQGLVARISLGGWFEFYDLFMTAYVSLGMIQARLFSATTPNPIDIRGFASFTGAGFAGMFVGTIFFSWISDRFGRRATFTYSLLWYSVATLVMAFQQSAPAIDAWRFLAGLGVGVQLVTIDTYVSEITPKESRGRYIALSQFVTYTAVPVVAFLSYALVPHTIAGLDGWRWVVIVGALGALAIWFVRRGLPESPRWLELHGRGEEAARMVDEIEARVERETGRPLPPPRPAEGDRAQDRGRWAEVFSPRYRRRTIMLVVFNFFQTIGFYGFASWVPVLLFSEGVGFVHSLQYTFVIALVNPIGPIFGVLWGDRLQRKWQVVGLAVAIAVLGIVFSLMRAPALVIVVGILITLANNWFSAAFHSYQAELYPTRIRAQAVGFVYSWSRFSSIFIGFGIAFALARYGTLGVFVMIAIAMAVVATVITTLGPRTSGERLEDLSP
jgi:putative MFS transporter